jgi:hypothetical protein
VRYLVLVLLAGLGAGCGSAAGAGGKATLWVTRDRGAIVVRFARVPAGESAAQALERVAKVETRYGGRYVQAVDGVAEHGRSSWFYYVNGYLADRSAANYRLRRGDLAWWDYRAWRNPAQDPVVVGAFPQPFLNGYDGKRRPAVVVSTDRLAHAVAKRLHARVVRRAPADANTLVLGGDGTTIALRGSSPGAPVRMRFGGDPKLLLRRWPFRYRYGVGG